MLELPVADLGNVRIGAAAALRAMDGGRLFLTGATGFVGGWLLASLADAVANGELHVEAVIQTRDHARFLARFPRLENARWVTLALGDVRSFAGAWGRFSHVVHCASTSSREQLGCSPLDAADVVVSGTRHVCDSVMSSGTRFLQLSSSSVYGEQPAGLQRITEEYCGAPDPGRPEHLHALAKRLAEGIVLSHARSVGAHAVIARGFGMSGPWLPLDDTFALGSGVGQVLRGEPVTVRTDGTAVRSYLYASDVAVWLWTALARGTSGRAYNVGSERAVTVRELAELVARAADSPHPVRILGEREAQKSSRSVPETRRAREELGVGERVGLEEGVARMVAWARGGEVAA